MTAATATRWVPKPVPPAPTPDEAAEALAAAEDALIRWIADSEDRTRAAETAAAELAEAEAVAGDEAFETPDDLDQLGEDLVRRRAQLEVSHRAVEAARGRVDAARRSVLVARAGDLRARVRRLREVAEVRQARTDALLAEVGSFERTTYAVPVHLGIVGAAPAGAIPLTQRMRLCADWLNGQADEFDRLAESSTPEQLAVVVNRPAPPVEPVEATAIAEADSAELVGP